MNSLPAILYHYEFSTFFTKSVQPYSCKWTYQGADLAGGRRHFCPFLKIEKETALILGKMPFLCSSLS